MAKVCHIRFNKVKGAADISQVLTGLKLLEDKGMVELIIDSSEMDFRKEGLYEHNSIVEVIVDDSTLAYDMADGYQSIHRKEVFDRQLDRITYYFKRSYDPLFHETMKNKDKVKPFGFNYYCTCKGNPYDNFSMQRLSYSEVRRWITHERGEKKWLRLCDYKNFVSHNQFEKYRLLFLTRLWDGSGISTSSILQTYPYLSETEASAEAQRWINSLERETTYRIKLLRSLKSEFGDLFVGGVENSELALTRCPDLIVNPTLTKKENYMQLIQQNHICIASTGLHKSIGWKMAEYVSNARAIISEPLEYTVIGDFSEGFHYLSFKNTEECLERCHFLLANIDKVHLLEENNAKYYQEYLSPDMVIKNTLDTIIK